MKRSTQGFTLIEVLLAIVLLSTILTVVAVALGGLARADRRSRHRIDQQRNVQRLIMQLRQDIHQASACSISLADNTPANGDPDPDATTPTPSAPRQTMNLAGNDGHAIRFQANDNGIVRTLSRDDVDQHREVYAWGSGSSATWTMDNSHALPMAILTLTIASGTERAAERYVIRTTLINSQPNTDE